MNRALVDRIADAVLYEGYILYPYRPSVKNRQRWTFGGLYPAAWCEARGAGDATDCRTECLVSGGPETTFEAVVRFLHLTARQAGELTSPLTGLPPGAEPPYRPVETLRVGDRLFHTWQEAEAREVPFGEVPLGELAAGPQSRPFGFPGGRRLEPLRGDGGEVVGVLAREQRTIEGAIEASAREVGEGLFRVALRVANRTPLAAGGRLGRDEALLHALVSTHAILGVRRGEFVSLLDPPERWREAAAGCRNVGTWPVLAGEEGRKDMMLSSPIILYDYPRVAPESPGDFFDGTEIDEMLALRILTMTDDEKRQMAAVDQRAGALLARTEAMARGQLLGLHGTVRGLRPLEEEARVDSWDPDADRRRVECVHVGPCEIRPGDRVRLRPRGRADILDLTLAGMAATVESIEQDYEGRVYLAVTVDDDPGRDLGALRQPGHRFFFRPEEVEPVGQAP